MRVVRMRKGELVNQLPLYPTPASSFAVQLSSASTSASIQRLYASVSMPASLCQRLYAASLRSDCALNLIAAATVKSVTAHHALVVDADFSCVVAVSD